MKKRKLHIAFLPFVFLLIPLFQSSFQIFEIRPLKGAFVKLEKPGLSWDDWTTGEYQKSFERYSKTEMGFFEFFVRFDNQIDFSVFKKIAVENIISVKSDHYMDIRYINEFSGKANVFHGHIERKMYQLKKLQDTLANEGIIFLIVLEPSKSRVYPELIPDYYLGGGKQISNYERVLKKLNNLEVDYLDFNSFYKSIKDTIIWPLFPDLSTHWSNYGMVLATDTLIGFTNQFAGNKLSGININGIEIDEKHRSQAEYDIGDAMNLFTKIPYKPLAYSQLKFIKNASDAQPKALFVADSYFYHLLKSNIIDSIYRDYEFWYYFKSRILRNKSKQPLSDSINITNEIQSFDIVYLMQSELTYNDFGWGFIESLYDSYFPEDKETKYQYYLRQVLKNDKLIEKSRKEALANDISVEDAITENIYYLFTKEFKENKSEFIEDYYTYYKYVIANDSTWLKAVMEKANAKNIGLSKMIRLDAEWMYYKDHPEKKKK